MSKVVYLIFSFNFLHVRLELFNLLLVLFHLSFKPLVLKQQKNKQCMHVFFCIYHDWVLLVYCVWVAFCSLVASPINCRL